MVEAHAHPHFHQVPRYYGVGGLVLYQFANDVDENAAFRYSAAHSALIYDEKFFGEVGTVDLRGLTFGAIITHEYPQTINVHPIYDLKVITRHGDFNLEGACHRDELEANCFCALGCRRSLHPTCQQPPFCSPTPESPPAILPCPVTDDARCRWHQFKIGRWFAPPDRPTGLPLLP